MSAKTYGKTRMKRELGYMSKSHVVELLDNRVHNETSFKYHKTMPASGSSPSLELFSKKATQ